MIDLRVRSSPAAYQSTARGAVEPINEPSTSRQDDGELAGTPREPRMSTQKSFLVMALIKIVSFYNDLTVFLWRVGELHMLKLVNLTLICVVLYQVSDLALQFCFFVKLTTYLRVCVGNFCRFTVSRMRKIVKNKIQNKE